MPSPKKAERLSCVAGPPSAVKRADVPWKGPLSNTSAGSNNPSCLDLWRVMVETLLKWSLEAFSPISLRCRVLGYGWPSGRIVGGGGGLQMILVNEYPKARIEL